MVRPFPKASVELPNADVVFNGFPCSIFRLVVLLEFKAHLLIRDLDTKTSLFVIDWLRLTIVNPPTMLDLVKQCDYMRIVH